MERLSVRENETQWRFPLSLCLSISLSFLALAGCSGSGSVHIVPLIRTDLPPGEPLMQTVPISEAYYWNDSDGTLKLALRHRAPALLGASLDWQMSVVLEGLPAGKERLYRLAQREIRVVQDYGGDHRRSRSGMGVAVVEAPRNRRLKGRLHANVQQQQFGVLTGWNPPIYRGAMLVLVAEFEAVENRTKGEEILRYTESDGFERPSIPTSLPANVSPITSAPATAPQN